MITVYHFSSYLYQYVDNYKVEATGHRHGCATWTSSILAMLLLWFSHHWLYYRGSCLLLKSQLGLHLCVLRSPCLSSWTGLCWLGHFQLFSPLAKLHDISAWLEHCTT